MNAGTNFDQNGNPPIGDAEAQALAACYRLLIEKAEEYRRRNGEDGEPVRSSISEIEKTMQRDEEAVRNG